jgi:predicted phage-related endonuclease
MSLTTAQLDVRRAFLGGTDMAALAGVSRWATPLSVFEDKRPDLAPEKPDRENAQMRLGSLLEPIVADLFTEETGIKLRRRSKPVRCRDHSWEGGHLDRTADDPGWVYEGKWSMGKKEWDSEAGPVIPRGYMVQCQWYLHVTGSPYGHLGVLLGYGEFRRYRFERDEPLIETLVELGDAFWHDHVIPGIPPEVDGSEDWGRRLRDMHPQDDGSEVVATAYQANLLDALRYQQSQLGEAQDEVNTTKQKLMESMADATRMQSPIATVTWKTNKPGFKVDWEAIARELAADSIGGHIQLHGKSTNPARPFRVDWSEEE